MQSDPTGALPTAEQEALVRRLRSAWDSLPASTQAAVWPLLESGHQHLAQYVAAGAPPPHHTQMTLRLKSYLTGDAEGHLATLRQQAPEAAAGQHAPLALSAAGMPRALALSTGPDGSLLGAGRYEQLDPRWELVAGTVWLEHLLHKFPFPAGAPEGPVAMPDTTSMALLSDWGTGNFGPGDAPSVKIARFVSTLKPDYTIHLGDVYYAGDASEQAGNFLQWWPAGSAGSFALNSNHDMYSGGGPYFQQVVAEGAFQQLQAPWSFFALENAHWMVIGLDSAYFASAEDLYLSGTLGQNNAQTQFLRAMAERAGASGRRVILLTHHNPIPYNGVPAVQGLEPLQLFTEVMQAFAGQPAPSFWFYGHEHVGAAYAPLAGSGVRCRCLGHGALPWGQASGLASAQASGLVEWYENRLAGDSSDPARVYNGFVTLALDGPHLVETFYDELGRVVFRGQDA